MQKASKRESTKKGSNDSTYKAQTNAKELINVVGKPRKEVWSKFAEAHHFEFTKESLSTLGAFCGLDEGNSEEAVQQRKAFASDLNEAARVVLVTTILDLGRPRRANLNEAITVTLKAAKVLQKKIQRHSWELRVAEVIPLQGKINENERFLSEPQIEKCLSGLICNAEKAIEKTKSGGNIKKFSTTPSRAFAWVFDEHVLIPPEGCSPRCSEATVMENIKAARRMFVKIALSKLGIPFTRPLQNALSKIPISEKAFQRTLQQTR